MLIILSLSIHKHDFISNVFKSPLFSLSNVSQSSASKSCSLCTTPYSLPHYSYLFTYHILFDAIAQKLFNIFIFYLLTIT